jgi:transposase InsO family protein
MDDTSSAQSPDGPRPARRFCQVPDQGSCGQFTERFDAIFTADGIRILLSPPQAPRANAVCEPMIGTLRRELFDRVLIVSEHHLHQVLTEYLLHCNTARPTPRPRPAHTGSG